MGKSCGGRFKNITEEVGVGVPGRISVSASFADIDNDGDSDLFVTTVRGGNLLFENDGHGHFHNITKQAGVGAVPGAADAFSGHMFPERYEFPVLYRNLGHNRFLDVTAETGRKPFGWSGDASFTDLNHTGWPQIYFLNMMGANHFYENQDGKFSGQSKKYFPRTSLGGNDGRPDLVVTDMHSDMWSDAAPSEEKRKAPRHEPENFLMGPASDFVFGNSLYHNQGEGKCEEVSQQMGVENYWPCGPSIGDVNADGWEDIFIASSMNFPFRKASIRCRSTIVDKGFSTPNFCSESSPDWAERLISPGLNLIARRLATALKTIVRNHVRARRARSLLCRRQAAGQA